MARVAGKNAADWVVRWDLLLRYRLIEVIALWEGRLTTNHLQRAFGIGRQQASKDINQYLTAFAPKNLQYDRSLKGYKPSKAFKPMFTRGVADEYLQMMHAREDLSCALEELDVRELNTEVLLPPSRDLRPAVLRPILLACREGLRVEIQYASLKNPEPEYRVIQPHTVIHNGMRWHVRAWCEKNGEYRDFVLSRIQDKPDLSPPGDMGKEKDSAWQRIVTLEVTPDPRLSVNQQRVITRDYNMTNGMLKIKCRAAMASYIVETLRLNGDHHRKPTAQQVVLGNRQAVSEWLWDND
ncbi:helix-turn-helix transcriptional regulator [Alcanivorax profundi]|jgi:predicted DNA-binding transcriptional regulator YafY|uniref:helix-turn-helix transcriptional regulator n=1 Tax=Alcanivorax profundi TaxID=2338368 RepID=UPI0032B198E6|tara:strand:- start:4124 stop:5011 length:888 start_codon:yes stop_codon:yes gene_type:complete